MHKNTLICFKMLFYLKIKQNFSTAEASSSCNCDKLITTILYHREYTTNMADRHRKHNSLHPT